ncbi:hypothetical protein LI174_02915 [[Clostridium] symbiosum]|nr:hypothetical protein [[Clostridium] symbiosum]
MMLRKISFLLKNRGLSWCLYRGFYEFFNLKVPATLAKALSYEKERNGLDNIVMLKTPDGSQQAVHPDVVCWKKHHYLVVTPYPYGIDLYENPIIYVYANEKWNYCAGSCVLPDYKKNCHLSDPCFSIINNSLYLYYRQSLKGKNKKNWIYRVNVNDKGGLSERKLIFLSETEDFISPAVVEKDDEYIMFYVNKLSEDRTKLFIRRSIEGEKWGPPEEVEVGNMPPNCCIWHLSVGYSTGLSKQRRKYDKCIHGIFTLFNFVERRYENFYSIQESCVLRWRILSRIKIPNRIEKELLTEYKTTIFWNNNNKYLLVSGQDINMKWRIYEIEVEQSNIEVEHSNFRIEEYNGDNQI